MHTRIGNTQEDHYLFQLCPFRNATQFALRRALTAAERASLTSSSSSASSAAASPPWSIISGSFALGHWLAVLPDEHVEQTVRNTPSMRAYLDALPRAREGTEVSAEWDGGDGIRPASASSSASASKRQRTRAQIAARALAWRNVALVAGNAAEDSETSASAANDEAAAAKAASKAAAANRAAPFSAALEALATARDPARRLTRSRRAHLGTVPPSQRCGQIKSSNQ
jgi:hypothetical protein